MAAGSIEKNRGYARTFTAEREHQCTHTQTAYLLRVFLYEPVISHSVSKPEHFAIKDVVS